MKPILSLLIILFFMNVQAVENKIHDFKIKDIDGNLISFSDFKGKPILLVNTASRCGFTKQYANLSNLHREYLDKNLIIISTPSNSFRQELSEEEDVKEFCLVNYQTKFILTEIIEVKGDNAHPLYQWIANDYGKTPRWNFYKYLFDGKGNLVGSWSSMTDPDSKKITDQIDQLI